MIAPSLTSPRYTQPLAGAATLGGAALVVWSAAIHLHLWSQGYRHVPNIGPLFLAQALLGFGIAAAALAVRHVLTALAGAAYLAATSAGLLLSATIGVFNFHDGLDAPYAGLALTVQLVGLVLFGLAAAISVQTRMRARRTRHHQEIHRNGPPALSSTPRRLRANGSSGRPPQTLPRRRIRRLRHRPVRAADSDRTLRL